MTEKKNLYFNEFRYFVHKSMNVEYKTKCNAVQKKNENVFKTPLSQAFRLASKTVLLYAHTRFAFYDEKKHH